MNNKPVKPITVQELINFLNTVKTKQAIVGLAVDSEGNGFTTIPNERFYSEGFTQNSLGNVDFAKELFEEGCVPAIILFGSN